MVKITKYSYLSIQNCYKLALCIAVSTMEGLHALKVDFLFHVWLARLVKFIDKWISWSTDNYSNYYLHDNVGTPSLLV